MHNFRELKVWQKTRILVKEVYRETKLFPPDERFAFTSQIRRASTSMSLNIAEGCGRRTDPAFLNFVNNAYSSAFEVECAAILANDLEFWTDEKMDLIIDKAVEIQKMLFSLMNIIENRIENK